MSKHYYIGWDVGGWNCDKGKSRDAVVILDGSGGMINEELWRGNLKDVINEAETSRQFLERLFLLCGIRIDLSEPFSVVLGIDTPLAYSDDFVALITEYKIPQKDIDKHIDNPYLFRATERYIYEKRRHRSLSAVQDLIGSQSTKGIHVLSKFAPHIERTGVWTDHKHLRVLETYPSLHRSIKFPNDREVPEDIEDAYRCARVAFQFETDLESLEAPDRSVPEKEGWIWFLKNEDPPHS